MYVKFAGIIKPFEEACKLENDPASTDYMVYTGLENVRYSPLSNYIETFSFFHSGLHISRTASEVTQAVRY